MAITIITDTMTKTTYTTTIMIIAIDEQMFIGQN